MPARHSLDRVNGVLRCSVRALKYRGGMGSFPALLVTTLLVMMTVLWGVHRVLGIQVRVNNIYLSMIG